VGGADPRAEAGKPRPVPTSRLTKAPSSVTRQVVAEMRNGPKTRSTYRWIRERSSPWR